jgi:hypothetical protein
MNIANMINKLITPNNSNKADDVLEFSFFIENLSVQKRITRLDAILEFCKDNFIDPIEVVPQISQCLKDKIEIELQEEGKLPRFTTSDVI